MGTDSIKLFHKELADQIMAMEIEPLLRFLENNIGDLKQKGTTYSLVLFEMEQTRCSVPQAVENLLSSERTFPGLKSDLALDFAFGDEEIYLDYWGCYVVFDGDPEGSIPGLNYLPSEEEEFFRLLRPEHVDQMLRSLYDHIDDLTIMGKKEIEKVEKWRDYCAANPSHMVAYIHDF